MKRYKRRDAEKILDAASFGPGGTWGPIAPTQGPHEPGKVVVDEDGIWPNNNVQQESLLWKPCWELYDDADAPDIGATPGLPFPFTADQLAAFMLCGIGALVADEFGDWDQPPRLDSLKHPDLNRAKEAVQGAFDSFRRAQDVVGAMPAGQEVPLHQAINKYKAELQRALDMHDCSSRTGLGHDEYCRRIDLARMQPSVTRAAALVQELQFARTRDLAAWRKAMVRELLFEPSEMEAKGSSVSPLPRAAAQDEVILTTILSLGKDPKKLPLRAQGKSGVKREVRETLENRHPLFQGNKIFDRAWERLRSSGDIDDQN